MKDVVATAHVVEPSGIGYGQAVSNAVDSPSRSRSASPRGRPTKAESTKLQGQLLKVAAKEFLRHGYAGTTIDAIASKSKIGKMTIYRHFAGKERLFRAVVLRASDQFRSDFASVETDGRKLRDVIRDFVTASYDGPASAQMLGITRVVIAEAENFPDLAYTVYLQRRELLQPLTDYLTLKVAQGELKIKWSIELAAYQLVAMASGGVRSLMMPRDLLDMNREMWIEATVEVFLNGVQCEAQSR